MELIVETSVFDDERLSDDVQEVQQVASTAMNIAGNNSQYFWCTETGTDTGVHITLTPQDTFKANPSGYNLLARNNGVEVRDGLTACSVFTNSGTYFNAMLNGTNQLVAKYEASGAQIGAELSGYRNMTIDNTNGIRFRNGTTVLAKYDVGNVVFYDGNTTTNHDLMSLGTSGLVLKDNNGLQYASFGTTAIIGAAENGKTRVEITPSGIDFYKKGTSDYNLAHIGYGSGSSQTGTADAPYYTFGTRMNASYGNYSLAVGSSQIASGSNSFAMGYYCKAEGNNSIAMGREAEVPLTTSSSQVYGDDGVAIGLAVTANRSCQTVIGIANVLDTGTDKSIPKSALTYCNCGKYAFIIGNGDYDFSTSEVRRSNAFTVAWNGDVDCTGMYKRNGNNLYVVEGVSDSQSTAASALSQHYIPLSKTGYTPIGIVGFDLDGSSGLSNARLMACNVVYDSTNGYRVHFQVRNDGSSAYTWTYKADILWQAN